MKIRETWYKRALERNMLVLFFLGEEPTDLVGPEFVYLPGVGNDYASATHKQNLGIKYIVDNYSFDFVHICGGDTFLVIDNMVQLLENYDPAENVAIGGHGCYRPIDEGERTYFLSGGPGFLLSRMCCQLLYGYLEGMFADWHQKCIEQGHHPDFITAADLSISYYLQKKIQTRMAKEDDKFFHCTYYGHPCHPGQVDDTKIVACHLMSLADFDAYQGILQSRGMA